MNKASVTATPGETLADMLRVSGRGYTKIRHLLVQTPSGTNSSRPGKLGAMVSERKRRSLQLYLLLITVWPWLKNQEKPLPAAVWARALSTEKGRKWSTTNVSEAWTDLERRGLVERIRLSRGVIITPKREDGGAEYTDPGAGTSRLESYFTLPPSFWTDGWFEELSMPSLAMLLAIASKTSHAQKTETWLTNEDAAQWFGLSPRSVEGGLTELENLGLLTDDTVWIKAPLSAIGATERHNYSLNGPFSTNARLAMQAQAKAEMDLRLGKTAQTKPKKKAASKATTGEKARNAGGAEGRHHEHNDQGRQQDAGKTARKKQAGTAAAKRSPTSSGAK